MLVGRELESARVDSLLAQVLARCWFLRGETGIAKSALCRYAIEQAQGMIVLASRGVESEGELPYAALDDLDDGEDQPTCQGTCRERRRRRGVDPAHRRQVAPPS